MITPSWTNRYPVRPGWTSFYLHLSPMEDSGKITSYINDIKPSLLLFLRQLSQMTINIQLSDSAQNKSIELARKDVGSDFVVLEDSRSSPERFLIVEHTTKTYTEETKRMGIEESEIMLVFPLTETEMPKIEEQGQAVHAFLPIKSFGFTVCHPTWQWSHFLTRSVVYHPSRFLDCYQQRANSGRPAVEHDFADGCCGCVSESRYSILAPSKPRICMV